MKNDVSLFSNPIELLTSVKLDQLLSDGHSQIESHGSDSSLALAWLLSQRLALSKFKMPRLVLCETEALLESLENHLYFFDPNLKVYKLPSFDVDIYSGLYPSPRCINERLCWLHRAYNTLPGSVFLATLEGLLQKSLPVSVLAQNTFHIQVGEDLPEDLFSILDRIGYSQVPTVEDKGTYARRGGFLDVFSPSLKSPVRLELVGDNVERMRFFSPDTQITFEDTSRIDIIPARETLYLEDNHEPLVKSFSKSLDDRRTNSKTSPFDQESASEILRSLSLRKYFYGQEFLLPNFYTNSGAPLDFFNEPIEAWFVKKHELQKLSDELFGQLKLRYESSLEVPIRPNYKDLYCSFESLKLPDGSVSIDYQSILIENVDETPSEKIEYKSFSLNEIIETSKGLVKDKPALTDFLKKKITNWKEDGYSIFLTSHNQSSLERLKVFVEEMGFKFNSSEENIRDWQGQVQEQNDDPLLISLAQASLSESIRIVSEKIIFLRYADIWGQRKTFSPKKENFSVDENASALSFGDLKSGDAVVHRDHGVGIFEGLQHMDIDGAASEFIQIRYKGQDRLYLPVYRVSQLQKYTGPATEALLDKLGGTGWEKTKTKVKNKLRDIASDLLNLYAKRAQTHREPFTDNSSDYILFENSFPFEETPDQLKAISDVYNDMTSTKPMDRLVCGDVGFGKTEVAMRAAFRAVLDKKQVSIIAPTTILVFQHYENFKKRFKDWSVNVKALNRFISPKEVKETIAGLKSGEVDIVIGTHRLLSKDIGFKNLGLLIIDEEQKFGVAHKEKIRKMRESVDTLTLSATPIPRTLNMSFVGARDLSLINTPPEERLPTRTFLCKFDGDTIKKAIESEISRGGQVYFLHNRVQSIQEVSSRIREIVPKARIAVAHGQMDETQLEKTMLSFFNHEIDILVCTAIIESGMDIPKANTIFIDNAHQFGISQLYQLRGRVGRSKNRAYCYLILPTHKKLDKIAEERIRVIQENTALGSGLRVAHYDLELRGAGDILGAEQSGHIKSVGYELYLELLDDTIRNLKGEPSKENEIEPEINLRIPALIPDKYIPDIRTRLFYYKRLSEIKTQEALEEIENELRDQFGKLPEPVSNLMGLMLIRRQCKDLGVKDITSSKGYLSLLFTDKTKLPTHEIIRLTQLENKKYLITPDQKLKIRMKEPSWPKIYEEVDFLLKLCI